MILSTKRMEKKPKTAEVMIPNRAGMKLISPRYPSSSASFPSISIEAIMAGALIIKENLAAVGLFRPVEIPPKMVDPLLEIPGIIPMP